MGFCSEGRLASTNHRFPHCDLVLQHIPCHRTPAPNNLPGFNSFKGPAIKFHNGLGSRLAKQIAREHFGNKIDFQTLSPLPDRGIYIRKSFLKVSAFQPLKSISNSLRSHYVHFCQEASQITISALHSYLAKMPEL